MTLDQLRVFVAVAERQHITQAAQALNMTQSAVSAAIQALEQRHGVTLFDRVGRSIILNQAGVMFLEEARRVLAQAKTAEASLNDLAGLMRGQLSIMTSQTVGGYWLPAKLALFRQRYPGIEFDISLGNTHDVAAGVEAGVAELGIVEGLVDRAAIATRIIAQDEMIVVSAPGTASLSATPFDARNVRWLLREDGSGTRLAFDGFLKKQKLNLADIAIEAVLPGNEAVLGAVEAGMGVTLTSRLTATSRLQAGSLIELPITGVSRPFYLLRHKERYQSRAAQAFEAAIPH